MLTMIRSARAPYVRALTFTLTALIASFAGASEPPQPVYLVPVAAWPAPTIQAPRITPVRFRLRWPDLPARKPRPVELRHVVPLTAIAAVPTTPTAGTIPKEYLDAIAYQIAQIRAGDGGIGEDELFARAASLLKALKSAPPVEAELAEIRALLRSSPAAAPQSATPYATAWAYSPLMVHICNGQCQHR